ncbi:hypothetical protein ACFQRK_23120 [Parapedobacter sp. GCM10030251]
MLKPPPADRTMETDLGPWTAPAPKTPVTPEWDGMVNESVSKYED